MRLKHLDLNLIVTIVTANIIWALLPSHPPVIGIVLALPLVFLLPGYTLTEVLSHKRSVDGTYRFILSLGLSLSMDVLSGFILNILPLGLQEISWVVFLGMLTMVFTLLVAYLRKGSSIDAMQLPKFRFRKHEYILIGLSLIVTILSLRYSAISVAQQPHPGFTQLWILPSTQTDNTCAIELGVHSFETTPVKYRITMTANSVQVNIWSSVDLAPQEEWNRLVPVSPISANNVNVEVRLYKSDKPEIIYREVHMTLNVLRESTGQILKC